MSALIVLLILAPGLSAGEILTLSEKDPVEGEAIRLLLDEGVNGARLKVVYRPNSATSVEEAVGLFQDRTIEWTPAHAGIASLVVLDGDGASLGSRDVAIRFGGIPAYGILVMIVAGLLLFGGAGFSLALALRRMPEQ